MLQPDLHKLTHAAVTAYKHLLQLKELARLDCKFPTLARPVRTPATKPNKPGGAAARVRRPGSYSWHCHADIVQFAQVRSLFHVSDAAVFPSHPHPCLCGCLPLCVCEIELPEL